MKEKRISIIGPNGQKGTVPESQLQRALDSRKYTLAASNDISQSIEQPERISVINSNGQRGTIPKSNFEIAQKAGYSVAPDQQLMPPQSNSEVVGKSVASGLLGNLDIPQTLLKFGTNPEYGFYGIGRKLFNKFRGAPHEPLTSTNYITNKIQSLPENIASNTVKSGLKNYANVDLTPKPTTEFQRAISHGGNFAGGMAGFGLLNPKNIYNLAKNVAKNTAIGGAIGTASGVLQEKGVNPLVADIGASLAVPLARPKNLLNTFNTLKQLPAKGAMYGMGLNPEKLNIKAAQAAKDLGIDLPAAALTESKLTGLADQYIGKTPFFGDMLSKKYLNAEQQTKNTLEKIYEEVGPKKTPEIESEIAKLYDIRAKSLPTGAAVKPTHLEKAIDNIKINTAILSPDEKSLLESLKTIKNEIKPESTLVSKFGKLNLPLQDYSVDKLVGTKKSLNQIIKWDTDEGVKNQLRSLQHAVAKDIETYGKTNPKWYKSFKEADDLFAKVAKRENLENKLSGSINASTDNLGYANLSKRIHTPKQLELIKKQVSPEIFNKIEKLGTVARAMAIKNRAIPNPSGTAATASIIAATGGFMYAPIPAAAGVGAGFMMTKLLTDKTFLDLALKYAEKPNISTSISINKRIKEITGYSATVLNREINREQENE